MYAKGLKRSVKMWSTNFYKSFSKNILLYMSSRLSKIRSVHTYVRPRTVYFGWICIIGIGNVFLRLRNHQFYRQVVEEFWPQMTYKAFSNGKRMYSWSISGNNSEGFMLWLSSKRSSCDSNYSTFRLPWVHSPHCPSKNFFLFFAVHLRISSFFRWEFFKWTAKWANPR